MESVKTPFIELNEILIRQNDLLSVILSEQHSIREAVTQKNWQKLESALFRIKMLSDEFNEQDGERETLIHSIAQSESADLHGIMHLFPSELKGSILENYRLLRQKLAVSKIENDSLNEYITITRGFLQGIFDTVVPQSRGTRYSRSGEIIKAQPESLVLDQLF